MKRWIAALTFVCALGAIAYLPPIREESRVYPRGHYYSLRKALLRATRELGQMEIADSVARELHNIPVEAGKYQFVSDQTLPDVLEEATERALTVRWQLDGLDSTSARVSIAMVSDTANANWRTRATYYFGSNAINEGCVAIISFGKMHFDDLQSGGIPSTINGSVLLGPCAFYAAFGAPGPEIRDWLEATQHKLALFPDWHSNLTANLLQPTWADYYWLSDPWESTTGIGLLACAAGDLEQCRICAIGDGAGLHRRINYSAVAALSNRLEPMSVAHPLGDFASVYLASLVSYLGEERFGTFWRSGSDVESAFVEAAGIPIEDWTLDWVRSHYDTRSRRGPLVPFGSVFFGLAVATIVTASSAYLSRWRQVG